MSTQTIVQQDAEALFQAWPRLFAELAGKNVLITGAAGFLCAYFLDIFAHYNKTHSANPINILATDNFLAGVPARLQAFQNVPGIRIQQHDVLTSLADKTKFDYIIHGASVASPIYYRKFPIETIDANVNGTWNMLRRAQADASKAVLYFSSSEIYGDPDPAHIPTAESYWGNVSSMGPRACYDESKRLGETLAYNYFHQYQTPVKIVRPFNVYGPGQRLNDGRIVPDLMAAGLENRDIVLYSDGTPTRSFCYARDFLAGTLLVLLEGNPAEAYNVGNDEEISIREVANRMCKAAAELGRSINIAFESSADSNYLTHNPNRRCPNLGKMKAQFNWQPQVSVAEGLKRTLASYLEQSSQESLSA